MFAVSLSGELAAGPSSGSCGSSIPAGVINLAYENSSANKNAAVSASHVKKVNSPSSFVTLDGIGSSATVTRATFLFARVGSPMTLRVTYDDGSGGSETSLNEVQGLFLVEAPASKFVKLLEAQGVGDVEYFASGPQ